MTSFFRLGVRGLMIALSIGFLAGCQKEIVVPAHSSQPSASLSKVQSQAPVQSKQKSTSDGSTSLTNQGENAETVNSDGRSDSNINSNTSPKNNESRQSSTQDNSSDGSPAKTSDRQALTSNSGGSSTPTSSSSTNKSTQDKSATSASTTPLTKSSKGGSGATSTSNNVETVKVTIKGYNNEAIVSSANVPIQQGWTFLDATLSLLKERKIQYSVRGSGATAYVEAINNEYEFDHGAKSGWIAKKNGQSLTQGAGITTIKPGDSLEWEYTTGD